MLPFWRRQRALWLRLGCQRERVKLLQQACEEERRLVERVILPYALHSQIRQLQHSTTQGPQEYTHDARASAEWRKDHRVAGEYFEPVIEPAVGVEYVRVSTPQRWVALRKDGQVDDLGRRGHVERLGALWVCSIGLREETRLWAALATIGGHRREDAEGLVDDGAH